MIDTLNNIFDKKINPIYLPERKGEIKYSFADIGLAKEKIGFEIDMNAEEGLKKTAEWLGKTI